MTDDLIARLRDKSKISSALEDEAAAALEAQARRIAELEDKLADEEYVSKDTDEMFHEVRDENIELRARIAELEAAFEQAANDMRPMLRSMISRSDAHAIVKRAARAAYLGEKE